MSTINRDSHDFTKMDFQVKVGKRRLDNACMTKLQE